MRYVDRHMCGDASSECIARAIHMTFAGPNGPLYIVDVYVRQRFIAAYT